MSIHYIYGHGLMTQVQSTTDSVIAEFGRLDVMIANAGIPSKAGGLDDRLEDWHRVVNVDFSGAYYCARVAGEIFRRQRSGNLIFTASMSGHAVNVPQQQVSVFSPVLYTVNRNRPATMLAKQASSISPNPSP